MARQRSTPTVTYSNERPIVEVYDFRGKRKRVHLGTKETEKREIQKRYLLVMQALDERYQLPFEWVAPWKSASAAAAPAVVPASRRSQNSWKALLERAVEDTKQSRTRNAPTVAESSLLALEDLVPLRVKGTTPEQLKAIPKAWDNEGLKRSTQLKYLQVMHRAIDLAIEANLLNAQDRPAFMAALKPITPNAPVKHSDKLPDPESLRVMMSKLHGYYLDATWLLMLTGARPGELFNAKIEDIDKDPSDNWWIVPKTHKNTQRGLDRRIPITGKAREIIERLIKGKQPSDHILLNKDGRPLRDEGYAAKMRYLAKKLDVKPFTAYQLRHLAITKLIQQGKLLEAQKLAGHASLAVTTEVYAHALDQQAMEGAASLSEDGEDMGDQVKAQKMLDAFKTWTAEQADE
jgi:integrase